MQVVEIAQNGVALIEHLDEHDKKSYSVDVRGKYRISGGRSKLQMFDLFHTLSALEIDESPSLYDLG